MMNGLNVMIWHPSQEIIERTGGKGRKNEILEKQSKR